jgi:hypothetical protein
MQDKDKTPKAIEKEAALNRGAKKPAESKQAEQQPEPLDEDSLDHVLRHAPL